MASPNSAMAPTRARNWRRCVSARSKMTGASVMRLLITRRAAWVKGLARGRRAAGAHHARAHRPRRRAVGQVRRRGARARRPPPEPRGRLHLVDRPRRGGAVMSTATTTRPPLIRGSRISLTEMSKDSGALNNDASTCRCLPKCRTWSRCHCNRSAIASWRIIAPLGLPVDPDVKMT